MNEATCSNCHSERRGVQRAGFCRKCYYWHRKRIRLQRELEALSPGIRSPRTSSIRYGIRVASHVLEEYAWREHHRGKDDVSPFAVEALVYAVATECRSEVGFALHSRLAAQTPQARRCIFSILLAIVENIPCSRPRLNTLSPPHKGSFPSLRS